MCSEQESHITHFLASMLGCFCCRCGILYDCWF